MLPTTEQAKQISALKDPFYVEWVEDVWIRSYKHRGFGGRVETRVLGSIEFINGDTKGEQKFSCKDFADVMQQMATFIGRLK